MMRIPVIVITGFLGSGKTTLLNHLLRDPDMADTAVVINEFGEVAIDHLLVETSIENTMVLQSGCICCTVRGDLVDTLVGLQARRERGEIPDFARVIIETTGLADPAPVLQTLATDRLISPLFRLSTIVTTVDAVNGAEQLEVFPEPVRQVALADILLITKTDLAEPAATEALKDRLRMVNPAATIQEVVNGAVSPQVLFAEAGADPQTNPKDLSGWLKEQAYGGAEGHQGHAHDRNRHGEHIAAFCVTLDEPVEERALQTWLHSITSLRGRDLLRVKGVVNVAGLPGPMVVQGVQHVMHPPVRLAAWPDDDHRTRIVFIAQNIPQAALRNSLVLLARTGGGPTG